jgi:SMC interacting uncharacterized protein involved in chromosome segregation
VALFQLKFDYIASTYSAYMNGEDEFDQHDEELRKALGGYSFTVHASSVI